MVRRCEGREPDRMITSKSTQSEVFRAVVNACRCIRCVVVWRSGSGRRRRREAYPGGAAYRGAAAEGIRHPARLTAADDEDRRRG